MQNECNHPDHCNGIGRIIRVHACRFYTGLHTNLFSWWPDRATKIINYQFLVARTGNLVARKKKSEMNGGNIRLRIYNAKNKCRVFVFSV